MEKRILEMTNYMESVVFNLIDDIINKMGCCSCEKCRLDVAAIALNNLAPKYVVTDSENTYSKINLLQNQFEIDAISAITRAALIVKETPRHE